MPRDPPSTRTMRNHSTLPPFYKRRHADFIRKGLLPIQAENELIGEPNCSVCLLELNIEGVAEDSTQAHGSQKLVRLDTCGHGFHEHCILPWLSSDTNNSHTCPNCQPVSRLYDLAIADVHEQLARGRPRRASSMVLPQGFHAMGGNEHPNGNFNHSRDTSRTSPLFPPGYSVVSSPNEPPALFFDDVAVDPGNFSERVTLGVRRLTRRVSHIAHRIRRLGHRIGNPSRTSYRYGDERGGYDTADNYSTDSFGSEDYSFHYLGYGRESG
ncbi:hypothetical protein K505DRAFT_365620 [Melanomma pulvis-pyrius CBS 109.77]|uniref:RING-type domain-containing protein n=1 Tax=Melanomma pulvis-pyrius CBS 109.77 TaxID=1314802 RepID=A0A6A6WYZ9_9PLEO|nr:hypothetical protein K505DRAFT_365620 [Melanomma pulvis-pyrius CBS 109.77]